MFPKRVFIAVNLVRNIHSTLVRYNSSEPKGTVNYVIQIKCTYESD